jgi:tetratricopeptide (TPR) repeat protein
MKLLVVLMIALLQGTEPGLRDPRELPRAAEGQWLEWSPRDPIPDEQRATLTEGVQAYQQRDYERSLERFYVVLEKTPEFPPALYQASTACFRMRRYGDCIELLERFVRVAPHEVGATQALGHSLYSLGRYREARAHYERVLERSPDSVEAVRGYALSHMRLGELERALELLQRVVELRPEHADAHAWIAHVFYETDRLDEAQAAAERARELTPYEPRPWFLLSRILAEQGEDDAALEAKAQFDQLSRRVQQVRALEGVLLHDPRHAGALRQLVELRRRSKDPAVRGDLARLVRLQPGELEVHILWLDTMVELSDGEGARLAALELERKFSDSANAWDRLRDYYASIGDRLRQVQAGERHLRLLDADKKE